MKGAIGKMMESGEPGMMGGDPGKPPPAGQKQGQQAAPEEQDAYERAVLAGVQLIFDDATNPAVMKMLKSQADDPAQAIAQTTAMLIQILEEKSQNQLPEGIIMDLADELAGNVMALGAKQNLFKIDKSLQGRAAQQVNILLDQMYPTSPEDADEMMAGMSEDELAGIQAEQSAFAGGA